MITKKYLMQMSELDDEDGFDPADYSLDELFGENEDDFVKNYKAFYDDVKTSRGKFTDEDW
ncbi:MAG: hypothetical protein IJF76_00060 [Clostridia bacterium]|nr:hypothetical protein [Clostridia bacterium]